MADNNTKIFNRAIDEFIAKKKEQIVQVLMQVALETVLYIEGANVIPVQTGNLADSTGLGIYVDGFLHRYVPIQKARVPRNNIYGANAENRPYWGFEELETALTLAVTQFSQGIWLCLFSTMPYAMVIDDKYNFFEDNIVRDMVDNLWTKLQPIIE